jgi:Spy/CpxP family protein refolding chaperone
MKTRLPTCLGSALLSLALAGDSVALPRGGPLDRGFRVGRRFGALELTAEQRQQLQQLLRGQGRKAIEVETQIRLGQLDLAAMLEAEEPDRAALRTKVDQLAGLHAERRMLAIETRLEVESLLTPDQRDQLAWTWNRHRKLCNSFR